MNEQLAMLDLLSSERAVDIPGFSLRRDYVTEREERELLAHVEDGPWGTDFRRRVQQYGLGYTAEGGRKPRWVRDFPPWLASLAQRVTAAGLIERYPENSVVNEYLPPLGIGPHKDYPAFGPTVVCVSLGSDIVMDFIDPQRGLRVAVFVPTRSVWVITGEARRKWLHGIAPRLNDVIAGVRRPRRRRVSITFRTAKDASVASRR